MRYFQTNATETVKFIPSDYNISYDVIVEVINQSTRQSTEYNKTLVLDGYLFEFDITHPSIEGSMLLMRVKENTGDSEVYWSTLVTVTDQVSTDYKIQDGEYEYNSDPDFEYIINTED